LCDVLVAKMKTSRWSPPGEAARVRAPREAIGPRPELILDCSNAWVGIARASRYLSRTGQFNPGSSKNPAAPMTSKATHVRHTECALRRVPQGRPLLNFHHPIGRRMKQGQRRVDLHQTPGPGFSFDEKEVPSTAWG
jgi:hypothetical protein